MPRHGKKYRESLKLIEKGHIYVISEGVALLKKVTTTKFDATVEIAFNLNINPTKADQQLRGVVNLPHGTGKTKRVLALTGTQFEEATKAGADFVGYKDKIEEIQKGWFDYDVIVATPDVMLDLSKLGKLLGPKGLMPNPKTGTVTSNIAQAIQEIKAGKVDYRNDKQGNIHIAVGLVSFDDQKLIENIKAVCDHIIKIKPQVVKGNYIKGVTISSTMSPGVKINPEII